MKRFYKAMALVSLLGLGISNLFCGEFDVQEGYEAEARREAKEAEAIREAQARQEDQLFTAVERGDYKKVEELILNSENKDVLVNAKDGWTPLHIAAARGDTEVVQVLVGAGANKEARDRNGFTPLHIAAARGNTEVVQVLVDAGANEEAKNNIGWTPRKTSANIKKLLA
ncbi:MAG: ankyrin repeat domain-containing protein [Holosporales bacterium]|jgi:ankyrin repeat protein|nr:ankyrin repeat domain-containing protein [Holosporales bacterium]